MGADCFVMTSKGKNAFDAFNNAKDEIESCYHISVRYPEGYSGTICEKQSFVMIEKPSDVKLDDYDYADLIVDTDERIRKWGPAGCIDKGNGEYIFFGWASS
jgi:hypothetical protein